jgi:2-(1,2-epoxy-1,2-dihydrophenyl)acetyl-CoA isomerase
MKFKCLKYEVRDAAAYVTLDRPDKLNALNGEMTDELHAAAAAIAAEPAVRAVLLTGAGRAFCSGADLAQDEELVRSPGETVRVSLTEHMNPMIEAWHGLPQPVVVAVNGIAAGAGMSLALTGDLVIAARSAAFIQLFAPKVGLIPDLGSTYFLPRLVGSARAKALTLLGDPLPAAEAERWGLIWACVENETLTERAEALVRRLVGGPAQAFRRIKHVFNLPTAPNLAEQLALEATLQTELAQTEDFMEGVRAFRDKRVPKFSGR